MSTAEVVIVVPVYGDVPSVMDCLSALRSAIDRARHRVLIVNDCGPEVDAMEAAILELVGEDDAFRYERNDANLGFVGTCNRAVLELDTTDADVLLLNSDAVPTPGFLEELQRVLALDPANGAVAPRSNNATIASLPHRLSDPTAERTFERTREVFDAVAPLLPETYTVPVAMGFCLLIRRSAIREHGLFDEAFAPGYGEENDFCLRIGEAGYASLIANRAVVFHAGSKSFAGKRRNALRAAHQRILDRRYPSLSRSLAFFLAVGVDPVDRFAACLVRPADDTRRFSLDLRFAPAADVRQLAEAWAVLRTADERIRPEVVVRPRDEGRLQDLDGLVVRTHLDPDDIVEVAALRAIDLSPATALDAHRRGALVLVLEDGNSSTVLGRYIDALGSSHGRSADAELGLAQVPDVGGAARYAEDWFSRPLDERAVDLRVRADHFAADVFARVDLEHHDIADSTVQTARELESIKRSRVYRAARAASAVLSRVRGVRRG
ncbi:hypothetical protein GCM10017714_11960 [Curtobacterium pusillum]|uniref:Glycosyltransferase family 2 protein n=1 Tax=Curtobacterium pusillum TaxID=69373 RepID=A0ABX2M7D6_9MICO|nr:glycosyltransferase family 2 protein [Curtobacterium pusillum]NUU13870.1 glycosyltransferase family 2 protein [Curtobacterium pusillum]GLK30456.1 hypothetical protein GCM10017610_07410 [Curtobacterium pusillum]